MQVEHPEIFAVWRTLQDRYIGLKKLRTFYINGYTYGTDGYIHRDDTYYNELGADSPNRESCVIYLNKDWHPDWAGETVALNEDHTLCVAAIQSRDDF